MDYSPAASALDVVYYPDEPTESVHTQYSYTTGRITSARIVGEEFAGVEARWDMSYGADGRLESVTMPALDEDGDPPTTTFDYTRDSAAELDVATVAWPAKVAGEDATAQRRYGSNPSGTMAFMTNERLATENESFWTYDYSPANELLKERSPTGKMTEKVYDSNSNVLYSYDEMRHLDTFEYDALDRLVRHVDPRGCATYIGYETDVDDPDPNTNVDWVEQELNANEPARAEYDYDAEASSYSSVR